MAAVDNVIYYSNQLTKDKKDPNWLKTITYDEIDNYDFSKPFNEVIRKPEFVHLYFDFDKITNKNEWWEVYQWLQKLSRTFGKYSLCGYTNDNEQFGKLFKYIKNAHHVVSVHAVFYETKIRADRLMKLMKHSEEKGYKYNVNKFCDPNVYKLNTQQQIRHGLSDKYFGPGCEGQTIINKEGKKQKLPKNAKTAGSFADPTNKPSHGIITIRGDEKEIWDEKTFYDLFEYSETEDKPKASKQKANKEAIKTLSAKKATKPKANKKATKKTTQYDVNAVNAGFDESDNLIIFERDEMLEMLDNFDKNFNGVMCDIAWLYESPYDKEFLISVVSEWYQTVEHNNPDAPEQLINRFYKYEPSNKWFFTMLNKLEDEQTKEAYKKKYLKGQQRVDMSVNINNGIYTYEDIKKRLFNDYDLADLLTTLRSCVGIIDDRYYLKVMKNGQKHIMTMNRERFQQMTRTYKPIIGDSKNSIFSIVDTNCNYFLYEDAKIARYNEYNIINLFQGFRYYEINTNDYSIIQPFLKHVKEIICNNDVEKYNYLMCWYANIIQKITVKNGTLPIIHGAQGSGKSIVVEVFGDLIGNYALVNVDDLDKVFGKFNGLIGQHLYININEPPEADQKFAFSGKIKAKTTQKNIIQETKGVDSIEAVSWANYTMTTNNPSPVQEEKGNRRYIYFKTNDSKCGDKEYFNQLMKSIQAEKQGDYNKEFMGVLLHYMKREIDVEDYDPEDLIRTINSRVNVDYNEQLERQYLDLNIVDRYVVDNYNKFVEGCRADELPTLNGYTKQGIQRKLTSVCEVERRRFGGEKVRVYKLKDEKELPDLWAIIKYQNYDKQEDENSSEKLKKANEMLTDNEDSDNESDFSDGFDAVLKA